MRIVTWNMLGCTNAQYINQVIQKTNANVLCLQETGNMTDLLQGGMPVPAYPNSITGNFAAGQDFFECVFWRNNLWTQGGLAIMTNLSIVNTGILTASAAPYNPPIPRYLPWIEVKNPDTETNIRIYSVHSPPTYDPVSIADVCYWNNAQIAVINTLGIGNWAIVGDFNADPSNANFVAPPAGQIVRGTKPTQMNGGILDYSITNVAPFIYKDANELVGASDHYPQQFEW